MKSINSRVVEVFLSGNRLRKSSGKIVKFGSARKRKNWERVAQAFKHGWHPTQKQEELFSLITAVEKIRNWLAKDGVTIMAKKSTLMGGEQIAQLRKIRHVLEVGRGRMGGPLAAGPGGTCRCPKCGYTGPHKVGVSCMQTACPKCGTSMVREGVSESVLKEGGPGSGNFGHAGVPGQVGGSSSSGGGGSSEQGGLPGTTDKYGGFQVTLPASARSVGVQSLRLDPDGKAVLDVHGVGVMKFTASKAAFEVGLEKSTARYLHGEIDASAKSGQYGLARTHLNRANQADIRVKALEWFSKEISPKLGRRESLHKLALSTLKEGGAGSGNFGHAGIPGQRGGSSSSGGGGAEGGGSERMSLGSIKAPVSSDKEHVSIGGTWRKIKDLSSEERAVAAMPHKNVTALQQRDIVPVKNEEGRYINQSVASVKKLGNGTVDITFHNGTRLNWDASTKVPVSNKESSRMTVDQWHASTPKMSLNQWHKSVPKMTLDQWHKSSFRTRGESLHNATLLVLKTAHE